MSSERDPITDGLRWRERTPATDVSGCTVLTVKEAMEDAAPAFRAMRLAQEREDVLRRFRIGK